MVHRARAHEAAIDAQRSLLDAEVQQNLFLENRHRLMHNTEELAARAELATLDHDLAQDQLDAIAIRLRATAGTVAGEQMTPKDEENARLSERLRTIDQLEAELQLRRAEISLLRQSGSLANWLAATIPGATAAPADATPSDSPALPATLGTTPAAATGVQTPPTTGTTPSSLPSSPVSKPAPSTTAPGPPAPPQP